MLGLTLKRVISASLLNTIKHKISIHEISIRLLHRMKQEQETRILYLVLLRVR